MHDVTVAFHRHEIRERDGSECGDASDIVAGEIDEHEMFRPLLGVVQKLEAKGLVSLGGITALPCACDRADLHMAVGHLHMNLGGASDQREPTRQAQAEHVGGGINEA